jgi:hypothetical protein
MPLFFKLSRTKSGPDFSNAAAIPPGTKSRLCRIAACVMLLGCALSNVTAQTVPAPSKGTSPANTAAPVNAVKPPQDSVTTQPAISLSPAVIMARGSFGQGMAPQTLTLTNQTARDLAFELVAEDVVVTDGKRVFVPAGETENSIAASAVFSQKLVLVKQFSSAAVDVRLTLPAQTNVRAIVAMFRGTDKLPTSSGAVGMTASLGALVTFTLTDNIKLQPEAVRVSPASDTANMTISQWIANVGTEPALPEGTAAVLNDKGALVGKTTFTAQRLLPGERLEFTAEYSGQLPPGSYRALCSFQFEGKTLTSDAIFKVLEK